MREHMMAQKYELEMLKRNLMLRERSRKNSSSTFKPT